MTPTMGACAVQDALTSYLSSLTSSLVGYDYTKLSVGISQDLSATTLLATGLACLLGRVALGNDYLHRILWIVAALVGAMTASAALTQSSLLVKLLDGTAYKIGLSTQGVCLVNVAFVVGSAVALAATTHRMARAATFGAGSVAAGYGAYISCGLLLPIVSPAVGMDVESLAPYTWAVVGLVAIAGGLLLQNVASSLIDLTLAIAGALLVAQGLLALISARGLLSSSLQPYQYYLQVLAAASLLFTRQAVVGRSSPQTHVGPEGSSSAVYQPFCEPHHTTGRNDKGLIMR